MYFPGYYLFPYDPIFNWVPDEKDRQRMVSTFDLGNTVPDWALAFRWIWCCAARPRLLRTSVKTNGIYGNVSSYTLRRPFARSMPTD